MSRGRYLSVKKYECAVVVAPTVGSDVLENTAKKYTDIITSRGGKFKELDDWGKRGLAYEINYHREGYYHFYRFEGTNEILTELNRQLRIDENVLRHMIVLDGGMTRVAPRAPQEAPVVEETREIKEAPEAKDASEKGSE
jgi:small subunit ribosomal protein S6